MENRGGMWSCLKVNLCFSVVSDRKSSWVEEGLIGIECGVKGQGYLGEGFFVCWIVAFG